MFLTPFCEVDVTSGIIVTNPVEPVGRVVSSGRQLGEVGAIFADQDALAQMDTTQLIYRTEVWQPAPEGTPDVLQFGTSFIQPGRVGDEYFMTKGHLHTRRERPEIYWCIRGKGALVLQNNAGDCWAEEVFPGSVHHIFGHIAHRLVNTGDSVLTIGACWPLDAGHDYTTLEKHGFGKRVFRGPDGAPEIRANRGGDSHSKKND